MTKERAPITFNRALTKIAGRIGWDTCAGIVGVAERTVRNWSDPDTESEISLRDAYRLDAAWRRDGGDGAPLLECYALRLEIDAATSSHTQQELLTATAAAAREAGEAIAALNEAAINGSPREKRKARKEAEEAVTSFTAAIGKLGTD